MDFNNYITLLMQEKNIGLNELAARSEISPSHLSRVLRGLRPIPKASTIKKMASALDVDANHLLALAGYIEPEKNPVPEDKFYDIEEMLTQNKISYRGKLLTKKDLDRVVRMLEILFDTEDT